MMLKGIVMFLRKKLAIKQQPENLFAQRFGGDDSYADKEQWNGGRHLSLKEIQAITLEKKAD